MTGIDWARVHPCPPFDPTGARLPDVSAVADTAPYQPGSETSQAAARRQTPAKLKGDAARILKLIADNVARGGSGATCDECEVALRLAHQTASARIKGLRDASLLRNSGNRRPTRTGSQAVVWTVPLEYTPIAVRLFKK